ncbi:hypothetical protein C8Q78DRAFT_964604 [Trametes maxima]|nr:hypothetical protein C8Q78DRAFT_964604 [Trametes maxima]
MLEPIVFYDIPGKINAWSPNTWKTRYVLNYKRIPYHTVWTEYPDIEALCKKIGALPTGKKPDSTPLYTLPAIYDPNTQTGLAESSVIARYLDRTYPDTPAVIPPETDALHAAFEHAFGAVLYAHLSPIMAAHTVANLHPLSEGFFRPAREAVFGKLEEMAPPGPKREEHWNGIREGMGTVAQWLDAEGTGKAFFLGDRIAFADVTVASWLLWIRVLLGEDSKEWGNIARWDEGRWAKFMHFFRPFETVDEGTVLSL